MKSLFRSKKLWIIVGLLIVIRFVAPIFILKELNSYLAGFSPTYGGHVESLGISLFRGAYQFDGLELRLKDKTKDQFFYASVVDVSVAWRELIKAKVTTDVEIEGARVVLTANVLEAFKAAPKQSTKNTKDAAGKLFPVRVERLDLRNSSFEFAELISIPDAKRWRISRLDGRISNVTPTEGVPLMFITLTGALFDTAKVTLVGQVNTKIEPLAWDADLEMRNFELKESNDWLKRKMPLTFTSGKLDLFAEARSGPNGVEGYIKPFLKKADIVATNESFVGLKHFGIEVTVATINLILRTSAQKTLATKVLFAYENGEFKVNSAKAISDAFKNGFGDPIPEGIDDELTILKQATKKETP
ncbi:DUF748 domain-containing protein [soil metagenome]